ncbi:hypothetical protein BHU72_06745 [Desulfuribacillus stibiiarsenatis]|uniref:Diguanylate cyclase n=1 Tax=Desulfuribacillus stibiiarsenatis TaxID=1390249 RepID=A0A1E5L467_9FIRM|nr:EAL domain-containing protein [Desulfuribacillus stibiiarsenatis]OEH84886.1 hypothetical protein BHU72_06745 [Desulfuribacillus stibiiarsenatis]
MGDKKRPWDFITTKIKYKMMLSALVGLFVISFSTIWVTKFASEQFFYPMVEKNYSLKLGAQAELLDSFIAERLHDIDSYINQVSWNLESFTHGEELSDDWHEQFHLESSLTTYVENQAGVYEQLFVIMPDMRMISSLGMKDLKATEKQYTMAAQLNRARILSSNISNLTQEPISVIAAPIRFKNEVIGVIGGTIHLKHINQLFLKETEKDNIYAVNMLGQYVVHSDFEQLLQNMDEHLAQEDFVEDNGWIIREGLHGGDSTHIFYSRIEENPNWVLISEIPSSILFAEVNTFFSILLYLILAGIIIGLLTTYWASASFSHPIVRMRQVFEKAAAGDLFVRAEEDRSDELGQAAKSFNVMIDRLRNMTFYDPLTELPNLKYFSYYLNSEKSVNKRHIAPFGVILLSINSFKTINETHGFEVGDKLLIEVAKRLERMAIHADSIEFAARFGGDEFILLLKNVPDLRQMEEELTLLLRVLNRPYDISEDSLMLRFILGTVYYPAGFDTDVPSIISTISVARTQAKLSKKSYIIITNEDNNVKEIHQRFLLTNDLAKAIENNELEIYYQPIYDLQDEKTTGLEALLRWHHPQNGMISPTVFIPLAVEAGMIDSIGQWVLKHASIQLLEWHKIGFEGLTMSVNISPEHFAQNSFPFQVKRILDEVQLNPKYLQIEITEEVALYNLEDQEEKLKTLNNWGIRISVDDFGTGYSSFRYLAQLSINQVKIDKSFISNLPNRQKDAAIVKTIVSMSQALEMDCVAEGVETEEQRDFLRSLHCRKMQGYLLTYPLPATEMKTWLEKQKSLA